MQFKNKPKVAVFMVTYNHAQYIEKAIEGVLMQETDFPVKLFIGEDCSTDETREICLKYKEKYPDKIELLLTKKNIGGVANAQNVYPACFAYGDYTAMCEGDDYWTDSLKLQKQINFLEANPDFAICFHRVEINYEDDSRETKLSNINEKEVLTFDDLALKNHIHTPSCVFRNGLFEKFPDWVFKYPAGDWILHLLNARHGKVRFFDNVMAVYRVHQGGVWSVQNQADIYVKWIPIVKQCLEYFHPLGEDSFKQHLAKCHKEMLLDLFNDARYTEYRRQFPDCVKYQKYFKSRIWIALTIRYLLSYFPYLAAHFKKVD